MEESVEIKAQDVLGFDENENFAMPTDKNISTNLPKIMSPSKRVVDQLRNMRSCFLCETCGFQAKDNKHLRRHYYRHKARTLVCEKCPENCQMCKTRGKLCVFKTQSDLNSHVYHVHTSEKDIEWFNCEHCEMRFKKKTGLKSHMASIHLHHKETCQYCGLLFAVKFINEHIKVIHKNVRYDCPVCHFPFRTKEGLRQHNIVYHQKKPDNLPLLRCPKCSFTTYFKHRLSVHELKKHRHQKVWQCDFCAYKAKEKVALRLHVHSMHEDKKDTVKVRYYTCSECDYSTHRLYNMKVHELNHIKPENLCLVECFHCGYKTKRKDNLKVHIFKHDYYQPYIRCHTCQFETKSQAQYVKHIKANHSKNNAGKEASVKCNKKVDENDEREIDDIFNRAKIVDDSSTQNNNNIKESNQNLSKNLAKTYQNSINDNEVNLIANNKKDDNNLLNQGNMPNDCTIIDDLKAKNSLLNEVEKPADNKEDANEGIIKRAQEESPKTKKKADPIIKANLIDESREKVRLRTSKRCKKLIKNRSVDLQTRINDYFIKELPSNIEKTVDVDSVEEGELVQVVSSRTDDVEREDGTNAPEVTLESIIGDMIEKASSNKHKIMLNRCKKKLDKKKGKNNARGRKIYVKKVATKNCSNKNVNDNFFNKNLKVVLEKL